MTNLEALWVTKTIVIASFNHGSARHITLLKADWLAWRWIGINAIAKTVAPVLTQCFLSGVVKVTIKLTLAFAI